MNEGRESRKAWGRSTHWGPISKRAGELRDCDIDEAESDGLFSLCASAASRCFEGSSSLKMARFILVSDLTCRDRLALPHAVGEPQLRCYKNMN